MPDLEGSPWGLRALISRVAAPHRPYLALIAISCLLYLPSVWLRDLWNPDEPRYAEVAREMVSRGDYILPHLNGEVYAEKPPLFFWLGILAGWLPAVPFESGPRLVSVLAACGTLLLTFQLGRRLVDGQTGWLAALVLATSSMFAIHASSGVIDATLTLLTVAAISCGLEARQTSSAVLWGCFYLLAGLAVLAKGPVGLAIPALVILLMALQEDGLRAMWSPHPLWGMLLVAGVVAAWVVPAVARGGPDYASTILFKQNIGRAYRSWHHEEPLHYFLSVFPMAFLPWILLLPAALYKALKARRSSRGARLSLTWFLFTFVFFSLISGKKTRYMLPLFPAASLMVAIQIRSAAGPRGVITSVSLAACGVMMAAAGLALVAAPFGPVEELARGVPGLSPDQRDGLIWFVRSPGCTLLLLPGLMIAGLSASGVWLIRRERRLSLACILLACLLAVGWGQWVAAPAINLVKSARPLAEAVSQAASASGPVVLYRERYAGIFNVYLQRDTIPVLSGWRRIAAFIDENPGAVVIAGAGDMDRLRKRIESLRIFLCCSVGDETLCAATAGSLRSEILTSR